MVTEASVVRRPVMATPAEGCQLDRQIIMTVGWHIENTDDIKHQSIEPLFRYTICKSGPRRFRTRIRDHDPWRESSNLSAVKNLQVLPQ